MRMEQEEIKGIAEAVALLLRPLLAAPVHQPDTQMDVEQLSGYLGVGKKWIYGRTHRRTIPYYKIGGLLRFRKSEIDKWWATFASPASVSCHSSSSLKEEKQ